MSNNGGIRPQRATVITLAQGRPEQVASLTYTCSTAGIDPKFACPNGDPIRAKHNRTEPGLVRMPLPEASPAAGTASADHPDRPAQVLACRAAVAPPVPSEAVTLLRWLSALRRCWRSAVCLGLIAATIATVATSMLLPSAKYTAEAILQVYSRAPVLAFSTAETLNPVMDEYRRFQKTQIALLKSRLVLLKVLQKPGFAEFRTAREAKDPVRWLKDNLDVCFQSESEILRIALKGAYPQELASLVNAIRDEYMEDVVNVELEKRTNRYNRLKELNAKKLETLARQREQVRTLAESLGANSQQPVVLKQQIAIENQAMLEKEMLLVRSQKRRAEAELAARLRLVGTISETASTQVDPFLIDMTLDKDPSVLDLTQRVEAAETRLNQHITLLSKTARNPGADPLIGELKNEVRRARTALSNRRVALRPTIARELRSQGEEKDLDSVTNLRRQVSVLQDLEKRIDGERQQLAIGAQALSTKSLDLQSIQDEIVQAQTATTRMGNEIQALDVELLAPPRVLTIEDAEVPTTSDAGSRRQMIGLAAMSSFLASLLGMTFWELQARKVSNSTEIVADLGIHLIGTLPFMPVRRRKRSLWRSRASGAQRQYQISDNIDLIRAMLLNAAGSQTGRVFTITSAMPGEGKTSLSCHLASSLARSGRKTLLIDADLRRPSIHRHFGHPLAPGLCDLLRGDATVDESIVTSSIPDVDLLPAGALDSVALRSLSPGKFAPLLDLLRQQYDCVVIDTAPVLSVADTLLIASSTDGVILAVLTDVSRSHKIAEARNKLIAVGARFLGAVVIGDRTHAYEIDDRQRDSQNGVCEPADEQRRSRLWPQLLGSPGP